MAATEPPATGTVVQHQGVDLTKTEPPPAEPTAVQASFWAKLGRVARGSTKAPGEVRDWRLYTDLDGDLARAQAAGDEAAVTRYRILQEQGAKARREREARFVLEVSCVAAPVAFGGWFWFTAAAGLAMLALFVMQQKKSMYGHVVARAAEITGISLLLEVVMGAAFGVHPSPVVTTPFSAPIALLLPVGVWTVCTLLALFGDGKISGTELKAGLALAIVADAVYLGWHIRGLSWAWHPAHLIPPALMLGPALAWGVRWCWKAMADDGSVADDLRAGEPARVVDVTPSIETPGDVVTAMAGALKVKPADMPTAFQPVTPLTWDAPHRWRDLTVQMSGRTVVQLQEEKTQALLAGNLRVPADWLIVDEGANASQAVVHMATENPWPTQPTPAPILMTLQGDVWVPQRVGSDLLGTTPQGIVPVSSSIAVGGDTGSGKTALERLLSFTVLADPYAILDLVDFKRDSALSMFEAHAEEYLAGDAEDIAEPCFQYLMERRRELSARVQMLDEIAREDRSAVPDAKVTRELAHRYPQLRPRFILLDEFQDALEDPRYGRKILELLIHIARKGRSGGMKLILATQNWDKRTADPRLARVLSTRIALRMPNYAASAQILGGKSCKYRADLLPNVAGAAVIHPRGDGAALQRTVRVILDYASALDTERALDQLGAIRRQAGAGPKRLNLPACPPILAAMRDLLATRGGRMRSTEMAEALSRLELLPGLSGELDERARAQLLANLVRPYGVRPRPDRSAGNVQTYWLDKVDARGHQVGVGPAMEAFAPVKVSPGVAPQAAGAAPGASPEAVEDLPGVIPFRRPVRGG